MTDPITTPAQMREAAAKVCDVCGSTRPSSDFYWRNDLKRFRSTCKVCWNAAAAAREATAEKKAKRSEQRKASRAQEVNRARERKSATEYRRRHPEKADAKRIVRSAISRGDLIRPEACSQCGLGCVRADGAPGIQAHHADYSKPLDVVWLCIKCHAKEHRNVG